MQEYNFQQQFNENIEKYNQAMQMIGKVEVGITPKETIYSEDKVNLYRYLPTAKKSVQTPLLIVYALVNKYYIADLDEHRSLIKKLVDQGIEVYVIDWGYADPADRYLDLEDYIQGYIHNCVKQVIAHSNSSSINLLGICQGGVFSCCYTALNPDKILNLVTMVSPFDFDTPNNTLGNMTADINAQQAVSALGNVKGSWLNTMFNSLKPLSLNYLKYIQAIDLLQEPTSGELFLRMEKWIQDSPDQAGTALVEFVEKLYQKNMLVKGAMTIGNRKVDTLRITHPILNVYGTLDHIVPPKASKALKKLCTNSKDYSELAFETGHIGMYVSGKSREMPSKIVRWLQKHD